MKDCQLPRLITGEYIAIISGDIMIHIPVTFSFTILIVRTRTKPRPTPDRTDAKTQSNRIS